MHHLATLDVADTHVDAAPCAALAGDPQAPEPLGVTERIEYRTGRHRRAVARVPVVTAGVQTKWGAEIVAVVIGKERRFQIEGHPVLDSRSVHRAHFRLQAMPPA